MNEQEFLDAVRRDAPIESADDARAIADAVLETLGERVTDGAAADLADQLPPPLGESLIDVDPDEADPFPLETFVERVSDRAGIDEEDVVLRSRAVVAALAEATGDDFETVREQLPDRYDLLVEPAGPITQRAFLEAVRRRAGLDSIDSTRVVTDATLRTLGERLSAGDAEDLALYLPDEIGQALVSPGGGAVDYDLEGFVERVADRLGADRRAARSHVRAVCSVLAEAASERELAAAKTQLPDQFGAVFDPPEEDDGPVLG